nr:TonB dependent receptor [Pedobacter sp. ASV2]
MKDITCSTAVQKTVAKILLPCFFMLMMAFAAINSAFAQSKGTVKGKVITADGLPLPYASVALHLEDDKLFKGSMSDSAGVFVFSALPHGNYKIKVSSMGFTTHHGALLNLSSSQSSINLDKIILKEDAQVLASVQVTAQKKLIEHGLDRMVLNVENSILSEGNTALELLERAPGVKVDDEGKISLKGRPGVSVMINGKLTYLSPAELAILLKGTNSASISKIEILSNPSAKYDAAGNAGMINIVFKKNQSSGLNGSVSVNGGAGRNARYGSGVNLNYRNKNVNVFGSYNYAYRGETEYLDFERRFYNDGQAIGKYDRISNQHTKTNEPLNTHNFRFGVDFDLDTANTIGFLLNGNTGKYLHDSRTGNILRDYAGNTITDMSTTNYDRQNWQNLTYNLNYLHKFKKAGREFSADADYASNSFTSNLNLDTYTLPSAISPNGESSSRKGFVPAKTNVYIAKVDYKDVFYKTFNIETGLKSSIINSDNNLQYQSLNNGNWEFDAASSNYFKYKEQIHAGYLNMNQTFKYFSVQLGLRAEYTQTTGNQVTTATVFNRDYFQLFPTVTFNKPLGENHQLQFAYNRRIERPDYGDLNPFRVFRDPLLYYEGNPYLRPELTQSFMINHIFKQKYTASINYSRTKDVITWLTGQNDATNTTFESPQNLNSLTNYGIAFTGQTNYFSWWTASNFGNLFMNEYSGDLGQGTFTNRQLSFSANTQNSFKAGKGYSFELNGFYNSKSVYGTATEKAYYAISAAMQKQVLNDKGSIKLLVNDIFQTNQYRQITRYQNIDMYSHIMVDSRRVVLSFSYRFGKQIASRERKSGSEDIQNRVKGGG